MIVLYGAGFRGDRCELQFDACTLNPCANGGLCTSRVGSFTCLCLKGFTGTLKTHRHV